MIQQAEKHNLLAEVILSYGRAKERGFDISEATRFALEDWDIYDDTDI
jgi:hypothetical protein